MEADAGEVEVTVTGAVRSPYFSAKSFHTTTLQEWQDAERNHPAPWADFQSDKFMKFGQGIEDAKVLGMVRYESRQADLARLAKQLLRFGVRAGLHPYPPQIFQA